MSEQPPAPPPSQPPSPPPAAPPPPPPPAGPPPAYGGGYAVQHNNQKALWAMILGIVGIVLACCFVGFVPGVVALILGISAYREIQDSHGAQAGNGMAVTGIVLGGLATVLPLLWFIAVLGRVATHPFYRP